MVPLNSKMARQALQITSLGWWVNRGSLVGQWVARGSLILAAVREIRGSLTHPVLSIYYYTHNRVAADPRRPTPGAQKIRARSLRGERGFRNFGPPDGKTFGPPQWKFWVFSFC